MTIEQIIERYLPYTHEERSCAIKKQRKTQQRDAMKYDMVQWFRSQVEALQRAETPKKQYG